jgi:N-acetylmuramoyl-L-alanine amidase
MKSILNKIKAWFSAKPSQPKQQERETPSPVEIPKIKIGLIVGHEKSAPGADMVDGVTEYKWNSEVAILSAEYAATQQNVIVEIIKRDGIGISGAYRKADDLKCDCVIELHFNSFNSRASGTETLCSMDKQDVEFATKVHQKICEVFARNGTSRGVKPLPRSARGGQSIYSFPNGVNCLVEPFFGDNEADCIIAQNTKYAYAKCLVDACVMWAKR